MSRMMRWSATLLVFACLTAGAAQAWPVVQDRPSLAAPEVESRLEAAWRWLTALFLPEEPKPPSQTPADFQQKDTCGGDPNGRPPQCG
jgi:hypothetical protein